MSSALTSIDVVVSERVQKYLAKEGYGSRREIESWLTRGRITTAEKKLKPGDRVEIGDVLYIDHKRITVKDSSQTTRMLAYYKPQGEICTHRDPANRRLVRDSLPDIKEGRWLSIGRLDINTTGLLLFSNDGPLVHALMHPSNAIEREYLCRVFGQVAPTDLMRLCEGVHCGGDLLRFKSVSSIKCQGSNQWFRIVLMGGKNREIRRAWQAVGCQVNRLKRIRYGDYHLPQQLKAGQWLELDAPQIQKFKALCS